MEKKFREKLLAKLEQEQEDTKKEENIVTEKTVRTLETRQKIRTGRTQREKEKCRERRVHNMTQTQERRILL